MFVPGMKNLSDVMDEVTEIAAKWKPLGDALRLSNSRMSIISSMKHTDPTESLREVFVAWFEEDYDINKYGLPSWRLLCNAIKKRWGGNNPALARKIARKNRTVN